MLITRTPMRVPIGGGGSDLPSFYERHGGFFLSAAITRYVYIAVNPRFERSFRISYSQTEIVDAVDEVQHPIVREALRMLGLGPGIEIVSIADLPANSGMGSSGSFTVGLLLALHEYKGEQVTPEQLAEEAFALEAVRLGEPVGKQDQYAAACGGFRAYTIARDGRVDVEDVRLSDETRDRLERDLVLFHTGMSRRATDVLGDQSARMRQSASEAEAAMLRIVEAGREIRGALESGDCERFALLMNEHWYAKRRLSAQIAPGPIDEWYEAARAHGALGGKLIGAGGGGFFLFYCPPAAQPALIEAMAARGLTEHRLTFAEQGAQVVAHLGSDDEVSKRRRRRQAA